MNLCWRDLAHCSRLRVLIIRPEKQTWSLRILFHCISSDWNVVVKVQGQARGKPWWNTYLSYWSSMFWDWFAGGLCTCQIVLFSRWALCLVFSEFLVSLLSNPEYRKSSETYRKLNVLVIKNWKCCTSKMLDTLRRRSLLSAILDLGNRLKSVGNNIKLLFAAMTWSKKVSSPEEKTTRNNEFHHVRPRTSAKIWQWQIWISLPVGTKAVSSTDRPTLIICLLGKFYRGVLKMKKSGDSIVDGCRVIPSSPVPSMTWRSDILHVKS